MKYSQNEKDIPLKVKRNSWLTAAFLVETLLCKVISIFVSIPYISVFGMLIIMFLILFFNQKYNIKILRYLFTIFGILVFILLISSVMNGIKYVGTYLAHFLVFGTTAMFLMAIKIDYKTVLTAILKLSLLYIITYFTFERGRFILSDNYWSNQMGIAYGFLVPVIAGMICVMKKDVFKLNYKEIVFSWICIITGLYVICIDCGTRGAMVAIAISFGLLFIEKQKSLKKVFSFFLLFSLVVFILINLEELLMLAYRLLYDQGIDVPALTKMIRMMQSGIEDNGRNEIYALCIRLFESRPLLGHGIGYFESVSDGVYAHNIIMELLCEMGVIGAICMMFPLLKNFIKMLFNNCTEMQENSFNIFLFLISVPLLMFSSSYWQLPAFWMYFWFALKDMKIKIKQR